MVARHICVLHVKREKFFVLALLLLCNNEGDVVRCWELLFLWNTRTRRLRRAHTTNKNTNTNTKPKSSYVEDVDDDAL